MLTAGKEVIQTAFRMSSLEEEIQTQIVEIEDLATVMTNGVLHTNEDSGDDELPFDDHMNCSECGLPRSPRSPHLPNSHLPN